MVCWCDRVWRVSGVGAFRQVLAGFSLWKRLSLVRVRKCQRTLRGAMGCTPHAMIPVRLRQVGRAMSETARDPEKRKARTVCAERLVSTPSGEHHPRGERSHWAWDSGSKDPWFPGALGFGGVSGVGAIRRVPSGISTLRASYTCRSQKMPKTPRGLLWGVHPMADSTNPVRRGQVGRAMNETARHQGGSERGRAPPGPVG